MNKYTRRFIIGMGILLTLVLGYFVADNILFDGFKPRSINEKGFQADFFSQEGIEKKTAIVLIGGGEWGYYWGKEFANQGLVGFSLPYYRKEGLPDLMEEIPLEYFEAALSWLKNQPEVDPGRVIVMGASRNAELALLIAATFPQLVSGVIAYAPSSVLWSNTVLPFNSDSIKPSWTYRQQAIPFIPMEKISPPSGSIIETLAYWEQGLADSVQLAQASIKVENINGPILLFSGKDDKVWPSAWMSDKIEERLKAHDFRFQVQNIQYDHAGHLISGNPDSDPSPQRTGLMPIKGITYTFEFGGTPEGDKQAQRDSREKVFAFVHSATDG